MDAFVKLSKTRPLHHETFVYKGNKYRINIMPADLMKAAHISGYATNGQAYLSEDLEGRTKRFVASHEIYHLRDKQDWLGYFGMEFRANFMCGLKDSLGLIATINTGLKSGKASLYFKRMLKNNTTLTN